ncbi:MAG: hypothetical protein Q8903_14845, partial [Bacteroidota bacterium]|nr:hypothetical protein [Bacteroidota bacterium]
MQVTTIQISSVTEYLLNKSAQVRSALYFSYSTNCRKLNLRALRLGLTGSQSAPAEGGCALGGVELNPPSRITEHQYFRQGFSKVPDFFYNRKI